MAKWTSQRNRFFFHRKQKRQLKRNIRTLESPWKHWQFIALSGLPKIACELLKKEISSFVERKELSQHRILSDSLPLSLYLSGPLCRHLSLLLSLPLSLYKTSWVNAVSSGLDKNCKREVRNSGKKEEVKAKNWTSRWTHRVTNAFLTSLRSCLQFFGCQLKLSFASTRDSHKNRHNLNLSPISSVSNKVFLWGKLLVRRRHDYRHRDFHNKWY